MKNLDELINNMALCLDRGVIVMQDARDALEYLKEYRASRMILADNAVGYFGRHPVIESGGRHFAVRQYVPERDAWRCDLVHKTESGSWTCDDDDNWILSNDGAVICREVGWRRTEVFDA